MEHRHRTDEVLEQAALYALGTLEAREAEAFEAHLEAGCPLCEEELRAFSVAVAHVGVSAAPALPAPGLRQRLFARIEAGELVLRSDERRWTPGGVEKLSVQHLYEDTNDRRYMAVVRLEAGGVYAGHWHKGGSEELYVLHGGLRIGGQDLHAGDFYAAPPGNAHDIVSEDGCHCVILSPTVDEPLESVGPPAGQPPLHVVRTAEQPWHTGLIEGMALKMLYADARRGTMTAMVRMEPGGRLPRHRHVTSEQFYMLQGDATVEGRRLEAGDFYRIDAGTLHETTSTEGGCTFLLFSSCLELVPA